MPFYSKTHYYALLALVAAGLFLIFDRQSDAPSDSAAAEAVARKTAETETHLSYTRYGWRNIDYWMPQSRQEIGMDRVHPVIWSGLILLGTLALVFWSANEAEIDRVSKSLKQSFFAPRPE